MRLRLAVSSFAILIAVSPPRRIPSAQSSVPPAAAGKKNPLLKLAEPWPDADALKARRLEADARPLFAGADPLEFTLTAHFSAINKDRNPESTTRYPGGADRRRPPTARRANIAVQAERARPLPPHGAQLRGGAAARRVPEGRHRRHAVRRPDHAEARHRLRGLQGVRADHAARVPAVPAVQPGDAAVVPRPARRARPTSTRSRRRRARRATRCSSSTRTTSPAAPKAASSSCRGWCSRTSTTRR